MDPHKVILVEDEDYIRESLHGAIDWSSAGCGVAGVFCSAEEALDFLRRERVDIVISDIKMDGMSGLDMAQIIQQEFPETYILFLTGYGDLEKARRAIRQNAWDFLLKPTQPEELLDSLRRLSLRIAEKNKERASLDQWMLSAERAAPMIRQALLKKLYGGIRHKQEILRLEEELGRQGIRFTCYHSALIQVIPSTDGDQDSLMELLRISLTEKMRQDPGENHPLVFFRNAPLQWILLLTPAEYACLSNRLLHQILKEKGITLQVGVSSCRHSILHARDSLEEARRALCRKGLCHAPFLSVYRGSEPAGVVSEGFEMSRIYGLKEHLLHKRTEEISLLLRDFRHFVSGAPMNLSQIRALILRLLVQCEEALVLTGQQPFNNLFENDPVGAESLDEMLAVLRHQIQITSHKMQRTAQSRRRELMGRIDRFLHKHYAGECSISDVAEVCCRNEKYLSRYMKKHSGKTFSEYLCELRLGKAEVLLIQSGLSVADIASAVGFHDPAYFSRVFTRAHGISPREYRKKMSVPT